MSSTQMIICSNKKSVNYGGLNTRSKKNAKWTNMVNLDFVQGDELSINNAVVNLRGASSNETVEILGENNPTTTLADNKVGIMFVPYLNDNARENTVALPFTGSTNPLNPTTDDKLEYQENNNSYPRLDNLENQTFITPTVSKDATGDDNEISPINPNEMDYGNMFIFSYTYSGTGDKICSPHGTNVRTLYTASGSTRATFGHRYVVLDSSYLGPYKKDTDGNFWSGEDDCKPMELPIKIEIPATYASPSTLANLIDDQLHTTNLYGENEIDPIGREDFNQPILLPSITGTLLKNRQVNGSTGNGDNEGRQRLYGNMAVKNLNDWQALHWMMRMDLKFEGKVTFNNPEGPFYTFNKPVYLLPQGYMHLNDQGSKNIEGEWYPRVRKNLSYKWVDWSGTDPVGTEEETKHFYYTCLPQNFMIITNISYTEDNFKLLSKYQQVKEKYDGIYSDGDPNQENDIDNFRFHLDVGESQQGVEHDTETEYMYYMSQGNVDVVNDPSAEAELDPTHYGYSWPFFPFKSAISESYDKAWSSNRSDIVDVGYVQNVNKEQYGRWSESFRASIESISSDVPHRFKDNKEKNCSMAVKSRYDSSWRSKMKLSNTPQSGTNDDLTKLYEGNGYYEHSGLYTTNIDDSLSQKYNIGAYPIDMYPNKGPTQLYDLTDTYWIGTANNLDPAIDPFFSKPDNDFLFRIGSPVDQDHIDFGGYSVYGWLDFPPGGGPGGWYVVSDYYVYSHQNQDVKDGRASLAGATYDGGDVVDLDNNSRQFVVDAGDTKRWLMVIDEDNNNSHFSVYRFDNYDDNAGPDYGNEQDFNILGSVPEEVNGTWYPIAVTDLNIISTDPNNKYYAEPRFGRPIPANGNNPVASYNPDNGSGTVIGFMLYRDSATQNPDGTWDISSDFALPSMHQGITCVSTSFLDHEALWLINGEMFDTTGASIHQTSGNTINYISIGANDPSFTFENNIAKCAFSNLHNPFTLGLKDMPSEENTPEGGGDPVLTYDTTNIGKIVVKVNDDKTTRGWLFNLLDTYSAGGNGTFSGFGNYDRNYGLGYANGGISIYNLYGESTSVNNTDITNMTEYNEDNWQGSLLYKLGFELSDLIPKYGRPDRLYDFSKISNPQPSTRYDNLKPYSTNPKIDISMATSLAVMDYSNSNNAGVGEPLYSRSVGSMQDVNIDGSESEFIYASNLPVKNNEGFYLVYCNLVTSGYVQNQSTYSIIGNVMKNYISGDYLYSFQNPPIQVNFTGKITQIDIELRDANGNIVSLDDDNSIIFRHDRTGNLDLQIKKQKSK